MCVGHSSTKPCCQDTVPFTAASTSRTDLNQLVLYEPIADMGKVQEKTSHRPQSLSLFAWTSCAADRQHCVTPATIAYDLIYVASSCLHPWLGTTSHDGHILEGGSTVVMSELLEQEYQVHGQQSTLGLSGSHGILTMGSHKGSKGLLAVLWIIPGRTAVQSIGSISTSVAISIAYQNHHAVSAMWCQ